ncbi:MAG: nucleoside triphosphate pyrophosphohydrolase [Patescibacteria group bacterium]|nr:nucleoside triphosphate pyrophosphohydrolase [Patescibacteria group bacterium]
MREKYYHRKLIRDRIPELITTSGDEFETRVMDETEFEKELKKKLVEEARELLEAPEDELINELADVLELTKAIASHHKIDFGDVENYQAEKRKKRGGFSKKLFLIWSTGKSGR